MLYTPAADGNAYRRPFLDGRQIINFGADVAAFQLEKGFGRDLTYPSHMQNAKLPRPVPPSAGAVPCCR